MDSGTTLEGDRYVYYSGMGMFAVVCLLYICRLNSNRPHNRILVKFLVIFFVGLNVVYLIKIVHIISSFYLSELQRATQHNTEATQRNIVPRAPEESQGVARLDPDSQGVPTSRYKDVGAEENSVKLAQNTVKVNGSKSKSNSNKYNQDNKIELDLYPDKLSDEEEKDLVSNIKKQHEVRHNGEDNQRKRPTKFVGKKYVNKQDKDNKDDQNIEPIIPEKVIKEIEPMVPEKDIQEDQYAIDVPEDNSALHPVPDSPKNDNALQRGDITAAPVRPSVDLPEPNSAYPDFGETTTNTPQLYFKSEEQLNVLIISSWRSGSTLFTRMLASYPLVFLHNEPLDDTSTESLTDSAVEEFTTNVTDSLLQCQYHQLEVSYLKKMFAARGYLSKGSKIPEQCKGSIKKSNPCLDTEYLSKLCAQYPIQMIKFLRISLAQVAHYLEKYANFKVIWLYRDPRAVWNSRLNNKLVNFWCLAGMCGNLTRLCQSYDINSEMSDTLSAGHPNNFMAVKFEDYQIDPYKVTEKIVNFLEMTPPGTDSIFKNIMSVDDKTDFKTKRKWELELSSEPLKQVEKECSDAITKLKFPRASVIEQPQNVKEVVQQPAKKKKSDKGNVQKRPEKKANEIKIALNQSEIDRLSNAIKQNVPVKNIPYGNNVAKSKIKISEEKAKPAGNVESNNALLQQPKEDSNWVKIRERKKRN